MVTPNHPRRTPCALSSRPMLGGAAAGAARPQIRRAGNIVLACALSLSLVPSLAFAEETETVEGEGVELVAESAPEAATTTEAATESAPTTKTEAPAAKANEKTEEAKTPEGSDSSNKTDKAEGAQQTGSKTEATATPATTETPATPETKPTDADTRTESTAATKTVDLTFEATIPYVSRAFEPTGELTEDPSGATLTLTLTETGKGMVKSVAVGSETFAPANGTVTITLPSYTLGSKIETTVESTMGSLVVSIIATEQAPSVDKSGLQGVLATAKGLAQGQKSDAAWKTLQDAIKSAEAVLANDSATEAEVTQAATSVGRAMKAFNESENVGGMDKPKPEQPGGSDSEQTPKPPVQTEDGAVATPGGFYLVKDKAYTLPVSFLNQTTGEASAAATFLEKSANVTWNGEKYLVVFSVTEQGKSFILDVPGATDLGNGRWQVTTDSLTQALPVTFSLQTPVGAMKPTADLVLDTTSLPTESGKPIESEKPKPEGDSNQNADNGGATNNSSTKAEKFQVGHTYRVPISFTKQGGSATSMAAKYFGDTALVRPRANGTFDVTFAATSEGLKYINSLKYKGASLKRSGNQFTVNIPAASGDPTVPIVMDISMLRDLGLGDAVTADMHLYLSRAEDLGTGKDGAQASSSAMLAQTGDAEDATGLALAAVAAGAVAVACRRRLGAE